MLWGLVGARSAIIHVHMYSTSCHRILPAAAAAVAAVITLSAVDGDLHTQRERGYVTQYFMCTNYNIMNVLSIPAIWGDISDMIEFCMGAAWVPLPAMTESCDKGPLAGQEGLNISFWRACG